MDISVTPLYGGLLAGLYLVLAAQVITLRRSLRISIGDRGDQTMLRRQRIHGNFAEYVPLALLLLLMAELMGLPVLMLHGLGLMLLIGRCAHAYGVGMQPESLPLRTVGMIGTLAMVGLTALADIALAVIG